MKPQNEAVLRLLRERGAITAIDALAAVGSFRLAGRIHELRADGHRIESETVTTANGKRVARYRLIEKPEQLAVGF